MHNYKGWGKNATDTNLQNILLDSEFRWGDTVSKDLLIEGVYNQKKMGIQTQINPNRTT